MVYQVNVFQSVQFRERLINLVVLECFYNDIDNAYTCTLFNIFYGSYLLHQQSPVNISGESTIDGHKLKGAEESMEEARRSPAVTSMTTSMKMAVVPYTLFNPSTNIASNQLYTATVCNLIL